MPFIVRGAGFRPTEEDYCKVGDVVIADASEDYSDIGKAIEIIELSTTPLVAGLHTFIARPPNGAIELGFSGYLLRSPNARKRIMRIAQGVSVLGLSKKELEKLPLELPHPKEQRKIADFLTAIDTKIQLIAAKFDQAQTLNKGLLRRNDQYGNAI